MTATSAMTSTRLMMRASVFIDRPPRPSLSQRDARGCAHGALCFANGFARLRHTGGVASSGAGRSPRSGGVASSSRPARQGRAVRPSARRPRTVRVTRPAAPHPPGMPHPAVRRRPHPHPAASRRSRFPSWQKNTVWGKGEARTWRGHRLVRQSLWPYLSFWLFSTMRFPGRRADGERPATRRACADAPFPSNRGRDPPPNGDFLPARGKRTNLRPRTLAGERSRVPAASRPHRFKSPRGAET